MPSFDERPYVTGVEQVFRPGDVQGRGFVRRALMTIGLVHRVSGVPEITIDVLAMPDENRHGFFDGQRIHINRRSETKGLVLVHEIGHAIDRFALNAGQAGYASDRDIPLLAVWRQAVEQSGAVQSLRAVGDGLAGSTGRLASFTRYALRPSELFGRSYAQFIAERSADASLLSELAVMRRSSMPAVRLLQWEGADFVSIGEALDRLMERLGWTM